MAVFPFKKALVTGAAGDLGSVLCAELAAREVDLVITDRSDEALEEVRCRHESQTSVDAFVVDMTNLEGLDSKLRETCAKHSDIDLIVAVAGIDFHAPIEKYDWRDAKRVIDINLIANYVLFTTFVPHFLERGRGHVTAISSMGGLVGCPYEHAYNASKSGLRMLMDGLRAECRGRGVSFTTVLPGYLTGSMAAGNGFKVKSTISMETAAKKIIAATGKRRPILKFPWATAFQISLSNVLPTRLRDAIISSNMDLRSEPSTR